MEQFVAQKGDISCLTLLMTDLQQNRHVVSRLRW